MKVRSSLLFVFLFALAACTPASGKLTVINAWARPSAIGNTGAAYFVIENGVNAEDILLSAQSDIAAATEIHMSMMSDGSMMSMQQQESVAVPAKSEVEFKPGGLHIMFIDLKRDLRVGDTFTLTLKFEKAGEVVLQVEVKEQP